MATTASPAPFFRPSVTRGDLRLPPFDKVLAVTLAPEGDEKPIRLRRAYPIKALKEAGGVVNDMLEKTPVAVFLDPETVTASAFSRQIDGKTLTLEARKRDDGTLAYYDKETGTRWNIEGLGEEGGLMGKTLTRLGQPPQPMVWLGGLFPRHDYLWTYGCAAARRPVCTKADRGEEGRKTSPPRLLRRRKTSGCDLSAMRRQCASFRTGQVPVTAFRT